MACKTVTHEKALCDRAFVRNKEQQSVIFQRFGKDNSTRRQMYEKTINHCLDALAPLLAMIRKFRVCAPAQNAFKGDSLSLVCTDTTVRTDDRI